MNTFLDEEITLDDISPVPDEGNAEQDDRVAVIGMSVLTSSGDAADFWEDLKNGGNLVSRFRSGRKEDIKAYNAAMGREYDYADGAFIRDIDRFDYKFFNMTPKEAELMDPCFRLFLQNTVKAIEDAGCGNGRLDDTDTRIYIGYGGNIKDSYLNMIWNTSEKNVSMSIVNNMTGMLGGRLSYMLNTHGTAQIIDATCASSLTAVHEGCESILSGKCSIVIVGSMRLNLMPVESESARIGVESGDYQTRTFDENASGFGEGDGIVTLVLKSYQKAVRDKDSIHAVIKASAVTQGGKSMGLTVTNPTALKDTIADVILKANQNVDNIGMYELHGTATNLGDPIEMQGMTDAFRMFTGNRSFCAVGSVKSNMGHLYEASGIMGLVKAILALEHRTLPPTINLTEPNKEILFVDSPFYINTKARYWSCKEGKRSALVNSLGLNGANCCVLVEEYENKTEQNKPLRQKFLALSAKSDFSLKKLAESYIFYLKYNCVDPDDLCYSAAVGRWHYDRRVFFEFNTLEGLIGLLSEYCADDANRVIFSEAGYAADDAGYAKMKQAYTAGGNIDFSEYFDTKYRMLHLPVYPFEEQRCWIRYDDVGLLQEQHHTHFYETKWEQTDFPICTDPVKEAAVIGFDQKHIQEYVSCCHAMGIKTSSFCIATGQPALPVPYKNVLITTEQPEQKQNDAEQIKHLIMFLTQLCTSSDIERITLITNPVHRIDGTEKPDKIASVLSAVLRAIQKEKSTLFCNIFETDGSTSGTEFLSRLMKPEQLQIAYRNGMYYTPAVSPKVFAALRQEQFSSGTYLVTAGTSIITQEICVRLAKHFPDSTFVFLSRSLADFDSAQNGRNEADSRIADCCRRICGGGGRVLVMQTDICNAEEVKALFARLKHTNITPDYLIHSASGDLSYEYTETDAARLSAVIDPKIKALIAIDNAARSSFKGYLLFSSMAVSFMAPMQSAYIAANAFINAFCDEKCCEGKPAIALQWSTWKEIGMAARKGLNQDLIFKAMPTETALSYFDEIIRNGITGNVIIGDFNLSPMGRKLIENSRVRFVRGVIPPVSAASHHETTGYGTDLNGGRESDYTETERKLAAVCRDVLGYQTINIHDNFFEMGADSLQIMNLYKQIDKVYPGRLEITDMFAYSNVSKLAAYLCNDGDDAENIADSSVTASSDQVHSDDIAIIGLAAKIPGAENPDAFYESLLRGECLVGELPKWRKDFLTRYYKFTGQEMPEHPFVESTYLDDIDAFDFEYFNISPREAALMDPHQRIYLELAVEAIEDAGYSTDTMKKSKTGVFLGFGTNIKDMYMRMLADVSSENIADAIVGNAQCVLAGRIAHYLDLKGASMVIDTACSSSVTALNTAIQYIRSGQISAALVGGIKLLLCPVQNDDVYTIGMESSDGFTRTFDQTATGTAFGESAQMILVKPYDSAVRDGDHIYGIIKSTAINQDGNSASVTSPNPISQQDVILEAWEKAGIDPEDLGFIEVHGTATRLGDTIEYKSLNRAFRQHTDKNGICALNTVKPNYGHMSEGAGLFSLIKGLLILKHGIIPKNILFDQPNRSIEMIDSALYYNTRNIEWKHSDKPRIFALSNFGMSGTNTHMVIQEASLQRSRVVTRKRRLAVISNRTEVGFEREVNELCKYLAGSKTDIHDLCYTLSVGRNHYSYRMAVVCTSLDELSCKLHQYLADGTLAEGVYFGCKKIVSNDRVQLSDDEMYAEERDILTEKAAATEDPEKLAELYCQGAQVGFERLFEGEKVFRTSLPAYTFTKKSCWIHVPEVYDIDEQLYYKLDWKETHTYGEPAIGTERKRYLVIADVHSERHTEIMDAIRTQSQTALCVYDIQELLVQYSTEERIGEMLSTEQQTGFDGIVLFMPERDCVYSPEAYELCRILFRIAKAVIRLNLMSALKIVTVSFQAFKVDGSEKMYQPLGAVCHGLNRVIGLELSNVSAYAIDADEETESFLIAEELLRADKKNYYAAFRQNRRYEQEIMPENISLLSERYQVKSDGVYVITGGTGGIGLYYAKCLAEENAAVRIVLTARSSRYQQDPAAMEKIRCLKEMGAEIEIIVADIADAGKTAEIFTAIKAKYGRINGVIHAAGNAGAQILALRSEQDFLHVMRPKYDGTWNVFHQLINENADFLVLCSSGCTLTGEVSQADYNAANSYLDAFTYYANQNGVRTHCINFSSWKSEGMSVRYQINVDTFFRALDNCDAKKALFEIINSDCERCFIGRINAGYCREQAIDLNNLPFHVSKEIQDRLEISGEVKAIDFVPLKTRNSTGRTHTELKGNDPILSYTETEIEIASIFSRILGLDTVNIYDSFFELGGDSILLGRLHTAIEKKYPARITLLDLFEYSSVKKIAEYLSKSDTDKAAEAHDSPAGHEKDNSAQIDDLVDRFERGEISIDDMLNEIT